MMQDKDTEDVRLPMSLNSSMVVKLFRTSILFGGYLQGCAQL